MIIEILTGLLILWILFLNVNINNKLKRIMDNTAKTAADLDAINTAVSSIATDQATQATALTNLATAQGTQGAALTAVAQEITDLKAANPGLDDATQAKLDDLATRVGAAATASSSATSQLNAAATAAQANTAALQALIPAQTDGGSTDTNSGNTAQSQAAE